MNVNHIPIWKKAPFVRLLLPFIVGIVLQWYLQFHVQFIIALLICFLTAFIAFHLLPLVLRFKLQSLQGLIIILILMVAGSAITFQKDIRNREHWLGNIYHDSDYIIITINEPLIEKTKSFKADGSVENVIQNYAAKKVYGKIILYFEKDPSVSALKYGDEIMFNKSLQKIKNTGNPGAFDYERYAGFKQIFHNVFLKKSDWVLLKEKNINPFSQFIFRTRQNILNILRQKMEGHNDELSIAEALLIGYTQDLDKDLIQAYANTGVVHIIAISGLHLGLIYIMLVWLFNKIPLIRRSGIMKVILILSSLWLFSLLTGGSASVLRSAVMFSCIVIGENFARRSSIYNSLGASAFILLCYNPYFLWDVGFQLSYLAVFGIVIFQKTIYHLFYIKNKWLNKVWELAAVSLAAQVFTFSICLYYFHQFPNTFLFTNLIMVPLSSLILFIEIFLVAFTWVPFVGLFLGKVTWWLVWVMNKIILWFNHLPYALWENVPASTSSTILLYCFTFFIGSWVINKSKLAFKLALIPLLLFSVDRLFFEWTIANQQKLIVYNVPQHKAIDLIQGNSYKFIGDSILIKEGLLQNFHLKPGRIALQIHKRQEQLPALFQKNNFLFFLGKRIMLIDSSVSFEPQQIKTEVDLIIISKNPTLYISKIERTFYCRYFVFDASNSLWKIGKWERDCEQLHLPFYSIPKRGAFIMEL